MSKTPLRIDKTCQNCNYVVENKFCPNCGQENTDTRKTFHHLFVHFFEDLTHYENSFWKTIRNLLLKPASLTKEYLSGKRLSYLAPVRLYIFISFVTFFMIAVIPSNTDADDIIKNDQKVKVPITDKNGLEKDSLVNFSDAIKIKSQEYDTVSKAKKRNDFLNFGYNNVHELDSLQKYGPEDDKLGDWEYNIVKKALIVKSKHTKAEMWEKFKEGVSHNFPKTLFVYMPLFALVLWLFHGKKRWYYFDHGIFTLHYFSFLLLMALLIFFFKKTMNLFPDNAFVTVIKSIGSAIGYIWMFYYFFPAHHRFYGETRAISLIKSIAMLFINVILMTIISLIFVIYTFINIH